MKHTDQVINFLPTKLGWRTCSHLRDDNLSCRMRLSVGERHIPMCDHVLKNKWKSSLLGTMSRQRITVCKIVRPNTNTR